MTTKPFVDQSRFQPLRLHRPAWWLIMMRELTDLWIGGKALVLILIYTVLMGVISFVFASNSVVNLMPPKEMVFELVRISMAFGGLIGLIIGADSISGERERATLEWLLVTPSRRRHIVMGKFAAAISPWPVAFAVSIPYWAWLAQGDEAFGLALIWGAVLGSLIIPGLTGLGMLVSYWSNTNRSSMFVSLTLYLLVLVPTQLPGSAQTGNMGKLFKTVSPMEAAYHFLEKIIVNNRTLDEMKVFLLAPAVFAGVVFVLLWYFSAGLRLEAGQPGRLSRFVKRAFGVFVSGLLVAPMVLGTSRVRAYQEESSDPVLATPLPFEIAIDMAYADIKAGDRVEYTTVVTNNGSEDSPPLILAMNIINLDSSGDVVDPEDWSPQRTQYASALSPGGSLTSSWRVNAILSGEYMVYMVVIPQPGTTEATSWPVTSPGIHLTVASNPQINPGGVLPLIIIIPAVVAVAIVLILWWRRRSLNQGEA
jgi:ABC-type transport system involved in multi-copper enzyme maturation permease subunit